MPSKVVVVFGASGTIGIGFIRACLESGQEIKVAGVFRSETSVAKTKTLLGNPPEDKFIPVVGSLASEQDAADILKNVEAKAGEITDVIASIGGFSPNGPSILSQTFENLKQNLITDKLEPHFICAKTFLPYLCDRPNTTYTVINGGAANMVLPNMGNLTVVNGALAKLSKVLFTEYKDKNVRLNEFMIACYVKMWDDCPPGTVSNLDMGVALLGVLVHPAAKCLSMVVMPDNMETIANTGITDRLSNN